MRKSIRVQDVSEETELKLEQIPARMIQKQMALVVVCALALRSAQVNNRAFPTEGGGGNYKEDRQVRLARAPGGE